MSSEISEILDPDASIVIIFLRILIGIVSVIGNGVLLVIFLKFKTFRSQYSNWLISLLAFSDFIIGTGLLVKAVYSVFKSHIPGGEYDRRLCAIIGAPQVLGVTCSQVMFISMATDRLIAVKMKTQHGLVNLKFKITVIVASWIISSVFVFFFLFWTLPSGPSRQCSVGAVAGMAFLFVYVIGGLLISVLIFSIYIYAIRILKKTVQGGEVMTSNRTLKTQQRVFRSISLLLVFYFVFCVIPLTVAIVALVSNLDEDTLGLISVFIGLGADVNSCVGIFIYLSRHEEVKKHFKILITFNQANNQKIALSPIARINNIKIAKLTVLNPHVLPWRRS